MNLDGKLVETLSNNLDHDFAFSDSGKKDRKPAAVLIPLIQLEENWHLLFIRRTADLMTHKGEVAFPGGGVEVGDRDFRDTALRETWEEVGISKEHIQILGCLPSVPTISNYCLVPIVGTVAWPTILHANPAEVMRIFTIPLIWLADNRNWKEVDWIAGNNQKRRVVHYDLYDGEHLWGITARLTLELVSRINKTTVE